jgi:hypothetical protein
MAMWSEGEGKSGPCEIGTGILKVVMGGGKFSAIFFQKIFRFLKSSLNISFFNLFLVALGLNEITVTVDIAEYRNKEKLWSRDVIWCKRPVCVSRSRNL